MLASQSLTRIIASRALRAKPIVMASSLLPHMQNPIKLPITHFIARSKVIRYTRHYETPTVASASSNECNNNDGGGDGGAAPGPMPKFGFRQIKGDGRCMFRALAQGAHYCALLDLEKPPAFLSPTEETIAADALRNQICDFLLENEDYFSAFIDSDESGGGSFEKYVENMRQERTFGGEPELAAAVDVVGRPISVFNLDPQKKEISLVSEYLCSPCIEKPGDWPVPLVYHAAGPQSGHYDLLAPVDATEDEGHESQTVFL